MAYTLSNLIRDSLDEMGQVVTVLATGGSTTTAADSNANGAYGDDAEALQNGTLFVVRDAAGAGAAPEGEMRRISDYDGATITVDTAFSAAIAAGDTVAIGSSDFPLQTCIQAANRAVQSFGRMALVDKTSVVPATGQTEYTWAVNWKYAPPFRIDAQTMDASGNNLWRELMKGDYETEPAVPGSTGLILFKEGVLTAGYDVRVWYWGIHPTMNAYNDPVSEAIHPNLAQAALIEKLTGWYVKQQNGKDNFWREAWNRAQNDLVLAKQQYPVWKPKPRAIMFNLGRS